MGRIVGDLSKHFDLNNYDALEYYDSSQWYFELLWRYRLYSKLQSNKDAVVSYFQKHAEQLGSFEQFIFDYPLKAKTFAEIDSPVFFFKNPHYKIFDDSLERTRGKLSNTLNPSVPKNTSSGIESLTIGEFCRLADKLNEPELTDESDKPLLQEQDSASDEVLEEVLYDDDLDSAIRINSTPLDTILSNPNQAVIKVDFSYKNAELVAAFKEFLKSYGDVVKQRVENERALKTTSDEKTRRDWCESRVIPYIDLLMWDEFSGTVMPKPAKKSALGLYDGDVDDMRTLIDMTKGLLNKIALATLKRNIVQ